MIPTVRLAWLVALGVPLVLVGLFGGTALVLAATYDALLLVAAAFDFYAAGDPRRVEVRREAAERWIQGRQGRVVLRLRWSGGGAGRLVIRDVPPPTWDAPDAPFEVTAAAGRTLTLSYDLEPLERGVHRFGAVVVRTRGPLGLVERQAVHDRDQSVRVYPDLVPLSASETSLASPSMWLSGVRRARIHGEGREFHQLREYQPGDDMRLVDWKAFAHRGRPTVREYRAERNQRVLLLVDSGRLMTVKVGDRLRMDWALQAAGRLARAALVMGDAVGLTVFSREIRAEVPPARGPGQLARLAEVLCEARPDLDEPDLAQALRRVLKGSTRRSLLVLFTELSDPRAAEAARRHIGSLAPRHLGLVVTLADVDLDAERNLAIADAEDAFRRAAADELWQETLHARRVLESRGAFVVRAAADSLAAEILEQYLEIKRRGRL